MSHCSKALLWLGRLCFQHSMISCVPLSLDTTTLVPAATSVWVEVLPLSPGMGGATSSTWMQQGDGQPLQLLLGRDTPLSSSSSPKARGCKAQLPCVNGARPCAGSCAAPWWHRAHRPGLAPSIDSPANDRECHQGQEQASWGHRPHRPAVLGGKGAGVCAGGRGRQWVVINGNEATCAGPGPRWPHPSARCSRARL